MRKALTVLIVAAVGASTINVAPAYSASGLKLQATIAHDGTGGLLVANSAGPFTWESCLPAEGCKPYSGGREVRPIDAIAGTMFRVRDSSGTEGVSPEWSGRLRVTKGPGIRGEVRANAFVSPIRGAWRGGWEAEFSEMQLAACRTPAGDDCTTLTNAHYARECPSSASFALDERFAGAYLRVAERRIGPDLPFRPAFAVTTPYGSEVWQRSRNTSIAFAGQIGPATTPYPGECGPSPQASAYISKRGTAFVECPAGCQAALVAENANGRRARASRNLAEQSALLVSPPTKIQLVRSARAEFGAEKVRLVVELDGSRAIQRTVVFPH